MNALKKEEEIYGLFLQEKPAKILVCLKKENKQIYTTIIAKEVNATYAHTFNVLKKMKKLNLVSFMESGRIKLVKLTELGEEVAKTIINLADLLKIGSLENELFKIYEIEIKGKLREQMNKESISKQLNKLKQKLTELSENSSQNVAIFSKKVLKKVDETLAEVFGYPPG
ncbi:MAG: hypothetical protein ACP5PX_05495 [Candidatus Hadarchaeum sp.]|uniref:hypothetical protein n=1 Tax=Candidatus Hadarchaeum sp. TaxID=2883567 RepID=UPI003D0BCB7A